MNHYRWKWLMFLFQLVQVVSVALVGGIYAKEISIRTYTTTILVNETIGTMEVFESELEPFVDIPLYYVYVAVPIITALHYLVTLIWWKPSQGHASQWYHFKLALERGYYPIRWIEYALSASLMTFALALLCGLTDAIVLAQLISVNIAVQLFGLTSEKNRAKQKRPTSLLPPRPRPQTSTTRYNRIASPSLRPLYGSGRSMSSRSKSFPRQIVGQEQGEGLDTYQLFLYGGLVFTLSWSTSIISSFYKHASDAPKFVWILVIGITLLYCSFPYVHYKYLSSWDFKKTDRAYDILSVTSKLFLDWTIIAGLIGWSQGEPSS